MNVLTIAGNVGRDSELRQVNTASGTQSVLSFAVAVKSSKKGDDGKYLSTWFDCSLWGKRADSLAQYIKKGQSIAVVGEVELEQYTNAQGQAGAKMKINVSNVTLQGGSQSAPQQAAQPAQPQQQPQQPAQKSQQYPDRLPPAGYQPQIGQPMQQNHSSYQNAPDFEDDIPFAPIGLSCKRLLHCI
jgi:single-strand DNA-binding protein